MNRIFYLMGKSASGKDTIYRVLGERRPDLKPVVLYTTRPKREGEKEGEDYFFVDDDVCDRMEQEDRIIELRSYHTQHGIWKYFTAVDGQIDLSAASYRMVGTLESYMAMQARFGGQIVPVYIEVEDGLRLQRALDRERRQRAPRYSEMCRRFLADTEDFSEKKLEEAGITRRFNNESLENCVADIEEMILAMI